MVSPRLTAATTLLSLLSLAAAHGDESPSMEGMDMATAVSMAANMTSSNSTHPTNADLFDLPSYAGLELHSGMMMGHIACMTLAWFFILPIGVVFSIGRSKLALPAQLLFLVINGVGVVLGTVYNISTPDLYERNAHHSIGWIATWIMTAQIIMSVLFVYAGRTTKEDDTVPIERAAFLPATLHNMSHASSRPYSDYRWSGDSGHGTEPPSPDDRSRDQSPSGGYTKPEPEFEDDDEPLSSSSRPQVLRNNFLDKYLSARVPPLFSTNLLRVMEIAYEVIDRTSLILGFIALVTGGVTYAGIFRANNVFNGLAHFIKGGIFFWYGLLTLGRWMGCFADIGWAWNVRPTRSEVGQSKANMPSAEFIESFLIFFYGASNVFLERLAGRGKPWSASDFEHVSIAVMFFGGGLCGMLADSKTVRKWLNTSVDVLPMRTEVHPSDAQEVRTEPKTYNFPLNPFPALIILLLGIMMSSHHQASMVSTMVHKQWGTLLCGAALCRGLTYLTIYLAPPTSIYPSRPPTELITAFCLISGGLLFMASTKDVIHYMEEYNLMAMFVFTVMMGFTSFVMAYEILVLALKGWAVRREHKSISDY